MKEKKVGVGNKVTAEATASQSEKSSASKKSQASKITEGSIKGETPRIEMKNTPP